MEIDHDYTEEIVCPHCGFEYSDSWDFSQDFDEIDCEECGKEFEFAREVETTYSTAKVKKQDEN